MNTMNPATPAPDALDNLTAEIPVGLRAPVKLLHDSAGIDPVSAVVYITSVLTAWAGDQLRVHVPGGLPVPVAGSVLMGLPATVDPARIDHVVWEALGAQEQRVRDVIRERDKNGTPMFYRTIPAAPEDTSYCTLLRNPDPDTFEQAEACNGFDQLMVLLSGSPWFEKVNTNYNNYDSQQLRVLVSTAWGRRSRIVRSEFGRHGKRTLGEIMVCVVATAPEDLVRGSARARGEYNIMKRSFLRHAPRFCAEHRLDATPLGPVTGAETRAWAGAVQRATRLRTSEKSEVVPDPAAMESFAAWERRIAAELQPMEPLDACELRRLVALPYRLYAGFRIAQSPVESSDAFADLAITLAESIWRRATQMFLAVAAERVVEINESHEDLLLRQLQDWGPMRRRDLMRKQSVQRFSYHEPALMRLLVTGRIMIDEFKRYAAVTPAAVGLN